MLCGPEDAGVIGCICRIDASSPGRGKCGAGIDDSSAFGVGLARLVSWAAMSVLETRGREIAEAQKGGKSQSG